MAKKKSEQQTSKRKNAPKGTQEVNLAADAATIVGTAIGVVGGAASFISSKVAEAVAGKPAKKAPAKKAPATKGRAGAKSPKQVAAKKASPAGKRGGKAGPKKAGKKGAAKGER